MRYIILGVVLALWLTISLLLAFFAGMGIFMMFITICHILFIVMLYKLTIIEMIRGQKYTQEQRDKIKQVTSSVTFIILLVVNNIILVVGTIILMFNNVRMIDLINR